MERNQKTQLITTLLIVIAFVLLFTQLVSLDGNLITGLAVDGEVSEQVEERQEQGQEQQTPVVPTKAPLYNPGSYSVKPNFYSKTDYNFFIYEHIRDKMRLLELCYSDVGCVIAEAMDYESKSGFKWLVKYRGEVRHGSSLDWQAYCEPKEEFALTSFVEAATICANSKDTECECSFSVPSDWNDIELAIKYDESKKTANICKDSDCFAVKNALIKEKEIDYDDYEYLSIQKKQDAWEIAKEKDQLPGCNSNKHYIKFCIISKDNLTAYDVKRKEYKSRPVAVKFAYFFKSKITDVENITVLDAKKAEDSVLIAWDSIETADVMNYTILYSNQVSIEDQETEELLADESRMNKTKTKSFVRLNAKPFKYINLTRMPVCVFDKQNNVCDYYYKTYNSSTKLEKDTLYFIEDSKRYFVILSDVFDNVDYEFGVIGIDEDNEKSPTTSSPEYKEESEDDLAPGIVEFIATLDASDNIIFALTEPETNIDGSERTDDLRNYHIYCNPVGDEIDLSDSTFIPKSLSSDRTSATYLKDDFDNCFGSSITDFRFVIVSEDKTGNRYKGIAGTKGFG